MGAFLDNVYVILIRLHRILEHFVNLLNITLELFLHPLSLADSLPPNFVFRLEIYKALFNDFDIKDGAHAFLCLAESFKLILKHGKLESTLVSLGS